MAKAKAKAKAKTEAPQEEAGLLDVTYDGIPGADKLTEKDAAPFVEDLSFDLDLEGNPKEEADSEEVEEDATDQAEGDEPEEEAPAESDDTPEDGDEGGEQVEEPVEEEVVAEADDGSEVEDKKKLMVPKARLDEVLAKQKVLQKKLDEQLAQQAEVQAEAPQYDFEIKEAEYQQLVLEGETDKATSLRNEIRMAEREQTMFEVQQKMGQTVKQSQEAVQLQATAKVIEEQYPILDENSQDYNSELADEVVELRDAFIMQGYQASDALTKATKYVVASEAPEPVVEESLPKKGNGEIDQRKKRATVQKKIAAAEAQPPDLKGQGNAERGEGTLDVNALSEDEFNALPEETLRRLRGDFG